jgi:hypothetical protein
VWCYFGSDNAAAQLGKLIRDASDLASVVYRFPVAFADRIDFIAELAASIYQIDRGQKPVSETVDPPGTRLTQSTQRSLAWLREVNAFLTDSRLYDALGVLSRFEAADFSTELKDLDSLCRDSAALCARILHTEIELVHSASAFVTTDKTRELTEQLMKEGFFRVVPKLAAVTADLQRHANFAKRCDLFSVLAATTAAFKLEVSKDQYGQQTSRLFAVHIGFLYQAALHEMAMNRLNEAFGLIFKAFEWFIVWEGLMDGNGYLYYDRLFDRATHQQFAGTGAVLAVVEKSLTKRDPNIFLALQDLTKRRNIARIGHGLRVHGASELTTYLARLLGFLKLTAPKRAVKEYVDLMEESFVFEGFAKQMQIFYSAEVLNGFRVVLETAHATPPPTNAPAPTSPTQSTDSQQESGRRPTLSLRPRPA